LSLPPSGVLHYVVITIVVVIPSLVLLLL